MEFRSQIRCQIRKRNNRKNNKTRCLHKIVVKKSNNNKMRKTQMKISKINNPRKAKKRIIKRRTKKYQNLSGKANLERKKNQNNHSISQN